MWTQVHSISQHEQESFPSVISVYTEVTKLTEMASRETLVSFRTEQ